MATLSRELARNTGRATRCRCLVLDLDVCLREPAPGERACCLAVVWREGVWGVSGSCEPCSKQATRLHKAILGAGRAGPRLGQRAQLRQLCGMLDTIWQAGSCIISRLQGPCASCGSCSERGRVRAAGSCRHTPTACRLAALRKAPCSQMPPLAAALCACKPSECVRLTAMRCAAAGYPLARRTRSACGPPRRSTARWQPCCAPAASIWKPD